ncbi:MAG: histidine kinase [Bifidobacteriaceae bacterium]|jgi:signal transduction histidine kinase|nr:histidine kinase [Bifidobacteriaceae bacterium]MCI1978467.1 histidine kinase [Bifidobacteriaceae bacterium]
MKAKAFFSRMGRKYLDNKADSVASALCLIFLVLEWATSTDIPLHASIAGALYGFLLVILPLEPRKVSIAIALLSVCTWVIPLDFTRPSNYWGTWYALIVLTRNDDFKAHSITAYVLALANIIGVYVGISDSVRTRRSIVVLCLTYVVAVGIGELLKFRKRADALQEKAALANTEAAYQKERTEVLHKLHDSVAATLTYSILLCRQIDRKHLPKTEAQQLQQVEASITAALNDMREGVIEPTKAALGFKDPKNETLIQPQSKKSSPSAAQTDELAEELNKARQNLKNLGFSGSPTLNGSENLLTQEMKTAVLGIVKELSANILKHGKPGVYYLSVIVHDDGTVTILSSNGIAAHEDSTVNSNSGLLLMRRKISELDGTFGVNNSDGEWTVSIKLPPITSHSQKTITQPPQ